MEFDEEDYSDRITQNAANAKDNQLTVNLNNLLDSSQRSLKKNENMITNKKMDENRPTIKS